MKVRAKVTSKGQITIPLRVRELLRVKPGDSVEFESEGEAVRVRPVRSEENPFEKYRGIDKEGRGWSRAALMAYMRELRGRDDRD